MRASLPERLFKFTKLDKKGQSLKAAVKGQRPAYSGMAKDFIPYTVYDRYKLFPNAKFKGPAIIEEKESTLIVGEDATVAVDDYGFLWVDFKGAHGARPPKGKAFKRTVQGKKSKAKTKVREVKTKAKPVKKKVQALATKGRTAKPKSKTVKPKAKVKSAKPKAKKSKAVKSKR